MRRYLLAAMLTACAPAAPTLDASVDAPLEAADEAQEAGPEASLDASTDAPLMDARPACDGSVCSGACVDTQSDRYNCGACGRQCSSSCVAGACVLPEAGPGPEAAPDVPCGTGLTRCGAECVNLATDPRHCLTCDMDCTSLGGTADAGPGAVDLCVPGGCQVGCAPGYAACGGRTICTHLNLNPNCGACGVVCPPTLGCVGSDSTGYRCCRPGAEAGLGC